MIAERLGIGRIHLCVVVDAVKQHGRLDNIAQRGSLGFEKRSEICHGLTNLCVETLDEGSVGKAELTGHVHRVSGADKGRVWTNWLTHDCDVTAMLQHMVGGIIIVVVLLVIFPVAVLMSFAALAALMGTAAKNSVDLAHQDSELLEISESNPY